MTTIRTGIGKPGKKTRPRMTLYGLHPSLSTHLTTFGAWIRHLCLLSCIATGGYSPSHPPRSRSPSEILALTPFREKTMAMERNSSLIPLHHFLIPISSHQLSKKMRMKRAIRKPSVPRQASWLVPDCQWTQESIGASGDATHSNVLCEFGLRAQLKVTVEC